MYVYTCMRSGLGYSGVGFRVFRVQGGRVFRIHGLEFVAFVKVSADWSLLRV